jgi:hypothetical protein
MGFVITILIIIAMVTCLWKWYQNRDREYIVSAWDYYFLRYLVAYIILDFLRIFFE